MNGQSSQFLHQTSSCPVWALSQAYNIPQPSPMDSLLQSVVASLKPILTSHHQSCMDRLSRLESSVEALVAMIQENRIATNDRAIMALSKYNRQHKTVTKSLLDRIKRLENAIGENSHDGRSLLQILESLESSLEGVNFKLNSCETAMDSASQRGMDACKIEPWGTLVDGSETPTTGCSVSPQSHAFESVTPNFKHDVVESREMSGEGESEASSPSQAHANCRSDHPRDEFAISVKSKSSIQRYVPSPADLSYDDFETGDHNPSDSAPVVSAQEALNAYPEEVLMLFHCPLSPDRNRALLYPKILGNPAPEGFSRSTKKTHPTLLSPHHTEEASPTVYSPVTATEDQHRPVVFPDKEGPDDNAIKKCVFSVYDRPVSSSSVNNRTEELMSCFEPNVSTHPDLTQSPRFLQTRSLSPMPEIPTESDYGEGCDRAPASVSALSLRPDLKRKATQHDLKSESRSRQRIPLQDRGGGINPSPPASYGVWPDKSGSSEKQVQCDSCLHWYHFACVGLSDDDPGLRDDEYYCPPCMAILNDLPRLEISKRSTKECCQRPDCDLMVYGKDQYYAQCFVGRMFFKDKKTIRTLWLVKWHGFLISDCTWQAESDVADLQSLVKQFEATATLEGLDLETKDPVFLREAVEYGWADKV